LFAIAKPNPHAFFMSSPKDWTILTRATLLARIKNIDDHKSWNEFYDTYWRLIYSVALKRGLKEAEAQDVLQETMLSVAKQMPGFKYDPELGSFKSWLLKTARWRIMDQFRKRQRYVVDDEAATPITENADAIPTTAPHTVSELEQIWDDEWQKNLLAVASEKARRRLSPKQYQIFDLQVNKGWDPEKVAAFFSITVDQVYLAKHRVTEAIKKEIERLQHELI